VHLVITSDKLNFLAVLDPLALICSKPNLDPRKLVVDLRTDILLIVGRIVLPYLEVSACLGRDGNLDLRKVMFFMPKFMSYISVVGLQAINDQS
jgi:hypothetical protein